jgi:hypothetical protein
MVDDTEKTWRERLEELELQIEKGQLTQDDVVRTQKTDCLSVLVDLKGTKAKLKHNDDNVR